MKEAIKKASNELTLGEFIKTFSLNNSVRLHYKIKGGHECVLDHYNYVSMDWEILKGQGMNRHYINNKVIGLVGIANISINEDAVNIVIEKLDDQPFIDEVIEEGVKYEECITNK